VGRDNRAVSYVTTTVPDLPALTGAEATSAELHRVLFDRHPLPLWVYDRTTRRILEVNDAAVAAYGYTREEFLALRIDDLRPEAEVPRLLEYVARGRELASFAGIWTHRRKDGSLRQVEVYSKPVQFEGRDARQVLALDVTERLQDEARLQHNEHRLRELNQQLADRIDSRDAELERAWQRAAQADHVQRRFLATVSHELRTPLNSIIGFSELLMHGLVGPLTDEQSRQVGIVNESGKHLLALVSDFLDISKIEAGVIELQVVPLDLVEVVQASLDGYRESALERGLTLAPVDVAAARPCSALGEPRRVRQVIDNLLSNAVKFTDRGSVNVRVEDVGDDICVIVNDTGIGIASEDTARLFEPFARIEDRGERVRDGTGLGLAIAKRLVQRMNGRIGVASEPGRGSRFWFTLPRAK
jgi:PAS domain S-box-containing protein